MSHPNSIGFSGLSVLSHHTLQEQKFFWHMNRCSKQSISTAQMHYMQKNGYIPIAYAPQQCTSVQNVSVITLPVPKTMFQHQAELSH